VGEGGGEGWSSNVIREKEPVLKKNGLFVSYGLALSTSLPKQVFREAGTKHGHVTRN
jgi:hypothetical protein